jgi:hypothetical protein
MFSVGDIVLYEPQIKKIYQKQHQHYILFLLESYGDDWWCGWFDYDGVWRQNLIPETFMRKINE